MPLLARDQAVITIRPAEASDIPVLRELADKTWRESYAAMLTPEQIGYMLAWMYAPETIARELADGVIWEVASLGDEAIGFHACTHEPGERRLKLNKIYLLPERQGSGFGQALLGRVHELAASLRVREVWLQVNKRNPRAIAAYERAGYRIVRSAVFDIGGGFVMDDFVMTCPVVGAGT
jgi:ribosomal protein S18 acetylase RimI-like enzyme